MWRYGVFLPAFFLLAGCAAVNPYSLPEGYELGRFTLPDQSRGWVVRCPGPMANMHACYETAARACPYGYETLGAHGEHMPIVTASGDFSRSQYAPQARYDQPYMITVEHSVLVVLCHQPLQQG